MEDLLTPSIVENLIYRFKRLNPKLKGTSHYEAYRVKIMATVAAWYKAHPEKVKAKDARRRAYKIGALGRFTAEEWQARKAYFNNRCVYCGQKKKNLTADHWIPLSEGGTNFISNIVPACRNCNSKKSNILGHVYNFQGKVQTPFTQSSLLRYNPLKRLLRGGLLCGTKRRLVPYLYFSWAMELRDC